MISLWMMSPKTSRRRRISPQTIKHIPQRTCVACREVKAKETLVRLVRKADKTVEVDTDGRKTGRGAYLCRKQACWESGFNGGRLEYTLRTTLTEANRQKLINFSKGLFRVNAKE